MTKPSQFVIDRTLARIDRERKRLREEFDRAMAKLDADERELLGMKPEAAQSAE
jgi:hypothetical protein